MGKTWDNRSTKHEHRIWFGNLLLHQFKPESHQPVGNPFLTVLRHKYSIVTLVPPEPRQAPKPSPEIDIGFPIKRLMFWTAIAVRLFSLPAVPTPPNNYLFSHFSMMLFLLVSLLFFAGIIIPRSVFLPDKEQTIYSVFEVYTPWVFITMILSAIILQIEHWV